MPKMDVRLIDNQTTPLFTAHVSLLSVLPDVMPAPRERCRMRLEVSETVHTPDPETVLHVLEICSRDVSSDVVRNGHQLMLYGFGPSPRSKNRHDKTVFQVNVENDKTVIHGEVNFQASAFLGDQSQYDVVRSKLDLLFDQVKLNINAIQAAPPQSAVIPIPAPVEARSSPSNDGPVPGERMTVASEISTPVESTSQPTELEFVVAPTAAEPQWVLPREKNELKIALEQDSGGHVGRWMTALVVLIMLISGLYFWYQRHTTLSLPPAQTAPSPATTSSIQSDVPAEPATTPAPNAEQVSAPDPKIWLQDWTSAMRTRDASAQAAFYADTVDFYMGQHNVSRDAVLRDRAATINMRKSLWTVKIEKIAVVQQTDSEAKIHLVKHFIDGPEESESMEWFVPSELVLKRIDGSWKITSERDLVAPSPASVDQSELHPID
jgi:ketosteroid isomerase-like protein